MHKGPQIINITLCRKKYEEDENDETTTEATSDDKIKVLYIKGFIHLK